MPVWEWAARFGDIRARSVLHLGEYPAPQRQARPFLSRLVRARSARLGPRSSKHLSRARTRSLACSNATCPNLGARARRPPDGAPSSCDPAIPSPRRGRSFPTIATSRAGLHEPREDASTVQGATSCWHGFALRPAACGYKFRIGERLAIDPARLMAAAIPDTRARAPGSDRARLFA
jgi:hypothetical protein